MMDLKMMATKINDMFNDRSYRTKTKEYVDENVMGDDVPTGQHYHGPDAFIEYTDQFVMAMPDIKGTVIDQKVDGNMVTTRIRGQGTFTGKMAMPDGSMMPGNGMKLDLEYTAEMEFNDAGKLKRYKFNYDMGEFMKQLGMDMGM